jgi:hypothetical protein
MRIFSALSVQTTITPDFLGSDVTRYNQKTSIQVKNAIVDSSNIEGVSAGVKGFLLSAMGNGDYSTLRVGAQSFGRAKLTNFSSAASDMVNYGEYDLTFESQGAGDQEPLDDYQYYNCFHSVGAKTAIFAYATSLSENWNYTRSANNFVVTHSITMTLNSQSGGGKLASPINAAANANPQQATLGTAVQSVGRTFASKIFKCSQKPGPWFEMGLDGTPPGATITDFPNTWKTTNSQVDDQLQGTSTYTQTFTSTNPTIDGESDLAQMRSLSFARQGDNWIYVSEKGTVEALGSQGGPSNQTQTQIKSASSYATTLIKGTETAAVDRIEAFFGNLKKNKDKPLVTDKAGKTKIIRTNLTTSNLSPEVQYELTLTNDIKFSGSSGAREIISTSDSNDSCYEQKTLTAQFIGVGPQYSGGNYVARDEAEKEYKVRRPELLATGKGYGLSDKPISSTLSQNALAGEISYVTTYSDNPVYDKQDLGYKVYEKTTSTRDAYKAKNYFPVLNLFEIGDEKNIIAQSGLSHPKITTYTLKLVGDGLTQSQKESDDFFTLSLGDAESYFNGFTPPSYWRSINYQYSIDPFPSLSITLEAV